MGTCLSKKKGSSSFSSPIAETKSLSSSAPPELKNNSANVISVSKPKVESEPQLNLEKDKKTTVLQEKQEPVREDSGGQVKKEVFIIKHRKSHDDRERNSKCPPTVHQNTSVDGDAENETNNEAVEFVGANKTLPPASAATMGVGVRTSSCTKEEVDAILIQCGRLSRSSSGKAASSSAGAGERRRRYSGSKRSYDFDHCDNDTISAEDDQRRANGTDNSDLCEDGGEKRRQHRPRDRQSPRKPSSSQGRRRTPSRERDQQQNQRSSSRERRVSRSPGRRSSETSNPTSTNAASAIASNNNSNSTARPGKMVSVPPTVSSLVMDKSNNGGGGESGVKRISVKRNVGDSGMVGSRTAASPRSQSPARANGNGTAANSKTLGESNAQQQPSLSRNSSRKADQSPYRRNPLSEIDPNFLAYPQSANNNNKKMNVDVNDNPKSRTRGVGGNCKPKEQQEEEVIGLGPMTENIVVKTVVPSGIDNLKQSQTLTRSRSSRRSRDLDINPETMLNPEQSYTSLLLEDIQNFHQNNTATPPVSLPACVTKACSIVEAVADLNSTTSSNLLGPFSDDRKSPPTCQSTRNDYNVSLGANHYGKKRVKDTKDPFVESEVVVHDDVMEPSFHKYVTVKRGGSVRGGGGADMEDQESSGSNSFTVSGQQNWGFSSSSWEPNSADSTDSWTSRLNSREEEVQKSSSGWASEAGRDMEEARKKSNSKGRECDHQHSGGIGRGRLGAAKSLHTLSVTAAATI
ncbi:uncharacterized protein At1g65710 [Prosopis cineraria]|uniref:uncharacterized protein At1g65710 n=1 Tax=Prosopis cineraria TaxID=364024 RepID=UPI00240F811D|nr:uncharacterized protein At1g65710 [Prosopis cineraria]